MKPALFHAAAEAELHDAIAFYESRRAGLGLSFQSEVERVVDLIQQHPDRWAGYKDTAYRKCSLDRFPFNVFYLELERCDLDCRHRSPEEEARILASP